MSEPSLLRAWTTPLVLTALCVTGLVFALVYDGAIDVFAVSLVVAPLVVLARALFRRTTPPSPPFTRIP